MTMTSIAELKSIGIKISPRQEQLMKVYIKAYTKAVVWVKNGKIRILEPDQVLQVLD